MPGAIGSITEQVETRAGFDHRTKHRQPILFQQEHAVRFRLRSPGFHRDCPMSLKTYLQSRHTKAHNRFLTQVTPVNTTNHARVLQSLPVGHISNTQYPSVAWAAIVARSTARGRPKAVPSEVRNPMQ